MILKGYLNLPLKKGIFRCLTGFPDSSGRRENLIVWGALVGLWFYA